MSTVLSRKNWMSGIDNATPISQMSIPGTHESGALHGGGPTQCQWHSVAKLLERGIRFLDIRCGHAAGTLGSREFPIYHSGVYQETNFETVQAQCMEFLAQNPTEFILMNVQHEGIPNLSNHSDDSFTEMFLKLANADHWNFTPHIPSVNDCRKKIVLVRAYDSAANAGWPNSYRRSTNDVIVFDGGLEWNGFNIDGTSSNGVFETQNGWTTFGSDLSKQQAAEEHLQAAAAGPTDRMYVNFLSRAGDSVGTYAQVINDNICQFLSNTLNDTTKRLGVVNMDFSGNTDARGRNLEDLIISHNPFMPGYQYH